VQVELVEQVEALLQQVQMEALVKLVLVIVAYLHMEVEAVVRDHRQQEDQVGRVECQA
jgi:hypothetical protein